MVHGDALALGRLARGATRPDRDGEALVYFATSQIYKLKGQTRVIKGFRDFILRGNVVDLAVAVVIGAAFGAVVTALTTDLITPLIAAIVSKPDFSSMIVEVHGGKILYGSFLNAVIDFLLKAAVVYFLVVVPLNYLLAKVKGPVPAAPPATKTCAECLSDIPLAARRCKFCGEPVSPATSLA